MVQKKILRLVTFLVVLLASCQNRTEVFDEDSSAPVAIDSIQRDTARFVRIKLSKKGNVNSVIESELMVREVENERPSKVKLYDGVLIEYYDADHKVINTVISKQGIYDELAQVVILTDSVVVQNTDHETLYTDYLTWADSTHEFYTDREVVINTRRQQITGIGLWATEDFSRYRIEQIKGVIQVQDNTF